jgi:hypothetical protein
VRNKKTSKTHKWSIPACGTVLGGLVAEYLKVLELSSGCDVQDEQKHCVGANDSKAKRGIHGTV